MAKLLVQPGHPGPAGEPSCALGPTLSWQLLGHPVNRWYLTLKNAICGFQDPHLLREKNRIYSPILLVQTSEFFPLTYC